MGPRLSTKTQGLQLRFQLASSDFLPHESVPEIYLGSAQGLFEGKKRHAATPIPHMFGG